VIFVTYELTLARVSAEKQNVAALVESCFTRKDPFFT
jgi:hypothetical protein